MAEFSRDEEPNMVIVIINSTSPRTYVSNSVLIVHSYYPFSHNSSHYFEVTIIYSNIKILGTHYAQLYPIKGCPLCYHIST